MTHEVITTDSNKEISSIINNNDIVLATGEFWNREESMYVYLDKTKINDIYGYYFGASGDGLEINKDANDEVELKVVNL